MLFFIGPPIGSDPSPTMHDVHRHQGARLVEPAVSCHLAHHFGQGVLRAAIASAKSRCYTLRNK
jgi:hypothetical protein